MELLTVQETADLLKVSTVTVRRFIADGRLPAVKVGRAVRVEKGDVERVAKPITAPAGQRARPVGTPRAKRTSTVGSLWNIVGIAGYDPDAPTDVADNVDKYLADAYEATHE
jgi:excisionase family DNA binding protein